MWEKRWNEGKTYHSARSQSPQTFQKRQRQDPQWLKAPDALGSCWVEKCKENQKVCIKNNLGSQSF